jgi:hypothetical protein
MGPSIPNEFQSTANKDMLTFLACSLVFDRYSPIWHWCSECTSVACHHSETWEIIVRYRAGVYWVVYRVALYFRRLQVSHAREILLRIVRLLSPCGLSGSKLEAITAKDHGVWTRNGSVLGSGQLEPRWSSAGRDNGRRCGCDDSW